MSESSQEISRLERLSGFERLYAIVRRLRAPDGCPWDRKQTPDSLKPFLLEELYECIEAIEDHDDEHILEELGDLLMLVTMVAYMMEQQERFTVAEVLEGVSAKLIRRHPHVFGDAEISSSEEVVRQWSRIKEHVEGRKPPASVLDKVPKSLPPLERAHQMQRRCSDVGFDWDAIDGVWDKVREEIDELKRASASRSAGEAPSRADVEAELGDLLFSIINLGRFLDVDPALALNRANTKFARRFAYVERSMKESGTPLSRGNFAKMDAFWNDAKRAEQSDNG